MCILYHNKSSLLWQKTSHKKRLSDIETIDLRNDLLIKKKEIFYEKEFIVSKGILYYIKNGKIKGIIDLNLINVSFGFNESEEMHYISFRNNSKFFDVYFKEEKNFKKWKKYLKRICVLKDFLKKYDSLCVITKTKNSTVFKAFKKSNKKVYAVKCISFESINEKDTEILIKSVSNEINIMRELNKELNITKLHYVYEQNNEIYIVMKYCNFDNLNVFMARNSEMDLKNRLKIFLQILHGIRSMHSKNIVHRDIKPENIFLHNKKSGGTVVYIGDFGLSNYIDKPLIFRKCGTPGYIAPELLNCKSKDIAINTKNDIFSIGAILYFLIYNEKLIKYKNIEEAIIHNTHFTTGSLVFNDKYKYYNKVIKECVEKNIEKRLNYEELIERIK